MGLRCDVFIFLGVGGCLWHRPRAWPIGTNTAANLRDAACRDTHGAAAHHGAAANPAPPAATPAPSRRPRTRRLRDKNKK